MVVVIVLLIGFNHIVMKINSILPNFNTPCPMRPWYTLSQVMDNPPCPMYASQLPTSLDIILYFILLHPQLLHIPSGHH